MLDFIPIYKRELKAYFQTPSTYVVMALFFLIVGTIFQDIIVSFSMYSEQAQAGMMWQQTEAPEVTDFVIRQIFQLMTSLILFTIPILTMRLVAEEKSKGTFELLVTCPIGDWSILLGKYFALLTVGIAITALAAIYPIITWWLGAPTGTAPEWPVVISCAVGLILIFGAFGAFGVMASAFTENQMTAAIITLIGLLFWQIIGAFQMADVPVLRDIVREISAFSHSENFIKGVLTVRDLAYYVLTSFLFLFIASKTLDARRWRI